MCQLDQLLTFYVGHQKRSLSLPPQLKRLLLKNRQPPFTRMRQYLHRVLQDLHIRNSNSNSQNPRLLLPLPLLYHRQRLRSAMDSSLFNCQRNLSQHLPRTPRRFRTPRNPRPRLVLHTPRLHPLLRLSASAAPLRLCRTSNPHSLAKHNPGSARWVNNHNLLTVLATLISNPTAKTTSINPSNNHNPSSHTHSHMTTSTFLDSAEVSGGLAIKDPSHRTSVIRSRRFMGSKLRSIIQVMALVVLAVGDSRHLDTNPRAASAAQGLVATLVAVTMGSV
jgi:hypothetical protein